MYPSNMPILNEIKATQVKVQKIAPFFEAEAVVNDGFKTISSADYMGKYWVLFFYPLDL